MEHRTIRKNSIFGFTKPVEEERLHSENDMDICDVEKLANEGKLVFCIALEYD